MVLEGGAGEDCEVWAVAFHPDGKHFFDGTRNGIRRWRVADGQELGKQTGMTFEISVSKDQKWVVCGTAEGASVWDAELREKVAEGRKWVYAVDVAPDCIKFATGTDAGEVNLCSITTGERLLGPLEHDGGVRGVRFSPDGGRLATACIGRCGICIFDAHNGDHLISIETSIPASSYLPIAWSTHGQHLFAVSEDYKIKSFDSLTGSPLAEWQIHENSNNGSMSISLSANGKFIASSAGRFVSFWDTLTHTQLGIVELKETHEIKSIALSPDGCRLAAGSASGSSIIWDLRGILPDSYLPGNVSTPFLKSAMTFVHESLFINTRKSLVPRL